MRAHGEPIRYAIVALLTAAISAFEVRPLPGQGLSGASVIGSVRSQSGAPIPGAAVLLIAVATGTPRRDVANSRGLYRFESVPVGSYRLEARAIGFVPAVVDSVDLHVGDRVQLPLVLRAGSATELERVTILANGLRDAGAGGPAQSIPREAVRNLPLLNRDFLGLLSMSSAGAGPSSLWISGQHDRFNGIQIDGAIGNDLFGTQIAAGSGAGGKALSIEALEELRILVAPADVRQSGFSGGLISAVTRSGTNERRGAVFNSYSRSELVGTDTGGASVAAFDQIQYGASAGGPIIRDRLHYFVVGELQSKATLFTGYSVEEIETGVTRQTALRAAEVFRNRLGFEAGGPEEPRLREPNANAFGKLTWHPSSSHSFELVGSWSSARSDQFNRAERKRNNTDGWQLSNSGPLLRAVVSDIRLKMVSVMGRFTNELTTTFGTNEERRDSRNEVPLFLVGADLAGTYLAGGSARAAQGTITTRRQVELTDNLSWSRGAHLITAGTQNVLFSVRDNFFPGSWGVWTFADIGSLERLEPNRYEVAQATNERGPVADYSSALLSVYAQDEWRPTRNLRLTAGLRADAPLFDAPERNDALALNQKLGGIDTHDFPSGNVVLAPRIGFALTLGNEQRTMLRGSVGTFTGRPPFVWITGAYSNTGQEQTTLTCGPADGVPAPVSDITRLPSECLSRGRVSLPSVTYFDPGFRFQRAIKFAAGVDHSFDGATSGSIDVVHTTSRDNMFLTDVNLDDIGRSAEGRTMYGSITSSGSSVPSRRDNISYGPVFQFRNVDSDRSTSVSMALQRQWQSGATAQMSYTWSRTVDVMSLTGLIPAVILRSNPVDGNLTERNRRRSARDIPHTFVATAIVPLRGSVTVAGFLRARSGTPFAFTVPTDANGDGVMQNDLAYVPAGQDDISLANPEAFPALDAFINSTECLRSQRGQIMQRNSCRNRAVASFDARIGKLFHQANARGFGLSVDVFNVPNLVNRNWGLVRETSSAEFADWISLTGWDAARNRPRYTVVNTANTLILPPINRVVPSRSRWRAQIGARYDF